MKRTSTVPGQKRGKLVIDNLFAWKRGVTAGRPLAVTRYELGEIGLLRRLLKVMRAMAISSR